MDLKALKITDKKPLSKTPKDDLTSFLCKIPVPIKSPKQKKEKRKITGNIVCSTPVNAVKRIIFEEDQQISPIRNPSSTTSKASSSPMKLVDDLELENKLQVNKINKMESKQTPDDTIEEIRDSSYPFPLVKKILTYNMVLCDSDSDIFPQKIKNRNKRGRKPTRAIKADKAETDTETLKINKTKSTKYAISDTEIHKNTKNTSGKKIIKSPSNTERLQNTRLSQEKNVANSNISKISTRSKNQTVSYEKNVIDEVTDVENISENNTTKKKINSRTRNRSNSPKTKKLKTETEKIEKDFKTENDSDVLLKTRTEKIKKDILNCKTKSSINSKNNEIKNNVDQNGDSIFNESIDRDNIIMNPISSSKTNNKTRKTNKDILNDKVADKREANSQVSDNLNVIKEPEPKGKRKTKTKNSKVVESSQDIRKSSRVRNPSIKYWLNEQLENYIENKNSIKPSEKLKTIGRPIKNKKTTKTSDKSKQTDEFPVSTTLKTIGHPIKNKKTAKTSDKSKQTDEPLVTTKTVTTTPEKIITDEPPEDENISTQLSVKNNEKLFKKSNKPTILTAGKIRKSLGLERVLNVFTPRKTPKNKITLQVSETDEYITEEENGMPNDSLLLVTEIEDLPSSEKGQKRKVESNTEMNKPKKVRLQEESGYSFKEMALSADVLPIKAGGLADVELNGRRCLLGCFGKFPRHYNKPVQNGDVSIGMSLKNGNITTGILEIKPAGKKRYERSRKANLLFLILEGQAQVGIGNSSQVLTVGQDFYVPKGTAYYIFNLSMDRLMVYFSLIH